MESLESLYQNGFILEEEYKRRKALLQSEANFQNDQSSSSSQVSSLYGVPMENYSYLSASDDLRSSAQNLSGSGLSSTHSSSSSQIPINQYTPGNVEYDTKPTESFVLNCCEKNEKTRSVRLFISSTFKDMSAEREILVKTLFPEIRRFCAGRLVNFVYIDFRWGITSEESAGGKVLDLCLDEIDKCRPYFIGILGERYGWSQQSGSGITDRLLNNTFEDAIEKHPWVDAYRDRSITEIEMLYGALFYPKHSKSFFYLRDPSFLDSLDTVTRRDYEPQTHGEQVRLADLKARILASGLPCSHYKQVQELANQVFSDLTKAIEKDFPLNEAAQLDEWDLQKQAQEMAAIKHHELYVPRPSIDQYLSRLIFNASSSVLCVHGAVGSGKSASVSHWAVQQKESLLKTHHGVSSSTDDPNSPYIIIRFIGMFSTKIHKVVMSILVELKRKFNLDKIIPSDKDEILHSLAEWLTIASVSRPIVLILDGIDKLESTAQTLNWLPIILPPQVHIVVTCPDHSKTQQVLSTREEKGTATCLPIGEMKESERREMIVKFLDQYSKKLAHDQIYLLTQSKKTSNPLFLRSILEQLRTFGDYDHLSDYVSSLVRHNNLEQLLSSSLAQWNTDFTVAENPNFVKDFFALIYASRGGMIESELVAILQISQQAIWSALLDATSYVLHNQAGLLSFANEHIKDAVKSRFFANEDGDGLEKLLKPYRIKIAKFFEGKKLGPRKVYEYPFQLVKLSNRTDLTQFLSSIPVFGLLYTDANKLDLFSYWQACTGSDAATAYKNQIKIDTDLKGAEKGKMLYNMGKFLHEYGKASEATYFFEEALKIIETTYGSKSVNVADVLHSFAMLKETQGHYKEAYDIACRSHQIYTTVLGSKSPKTAGSVWLQGLLQKKMNNYDKAIELFQSALDVAESYYGSSHPTTAVYLRNLADVYRNQALFDKAEVLYKRALEINRSTFGDVHPEVAECYQMLGRILKKRGAYDEARPLYEQAASILTQLFGPNHFICAEVYVNMADINRKIGEFNKSEELYNRALKIYKPELGEDHPDVGEILYLLSLTHKQTGNYEESIKCSSQAIKIAEKSFGLDHVKVAAPLVSLADVYSITAKYDDAISLYQRALKINEARLGKDHPECSEVLNSLGMICKKRGRYHEAKDYYLRSLEIVEKVFGPNHVKVAMYIHNLGVIYRKLKMHEASNECFQRAKKINVETFGEKHPLVAGNMVGIALAIVKSGGNLDEARDLLLQTIAIFEEKYGPNHEKVALSLNYLAEVYRKQGLNGRGGAETAYERALKINKQCYGDWNDHPEIAENLNGLAQVYKAQLNYSKAEPMFKQAIEMSERTLGPNHPHVINRYRNLALMYEAQGSVTKAEAIHKKIAELKAMPPLDSE